MRQLELQESSRPERHILSNDAASMLNRLRIATVTPEGGGEWTVANVRKVGVVRIDGQQILIRPKVPISRLFFMMQYAICPKFWLSDEIQLGSDKNLLSAMAVAFLQQISNVRRQGFVQGYETFEEARPMVRGRLDIAAQISRRGGLALPAQVVYDEFTIDVPENRLLFSALHRLLKLPMLDSATRSGLRKLTQSFEGVTLLVPGQELPTIHYTRLNSRYRPALFLSEMILRNSSVEHVKGQLTASAFLFDMWKIFEDFVTVTLANNLADISGKATRQETGAFLDKGATLALRPDLVWHGADQQLAIIDAKYKAPESMKYPNGDIYQMLAYCVRFGLDGGHLVYAQGQEYTRVHDIIGHQTTIHCHAVDLALPPSALLRQMSKLASTIAGSG
ncbi:McrC family protein [Paeniglutamicibacter sp. ABSL32-1]|uniref:McrC family protein n=1 Tax=Paeniglutamicibacter quisquiliarum TaxID=2849498 RepID=UPI001C2D9892|nr:McrC family protein [Paeniglutamicibacter quisquiliarum]MBV1777597.1 McrC family protein [Paeniglutamicibacter quisquiliarum]